MLGSPTLFYLISTIYTLEMLFQMIFAQTDTSLNNTRISVAVNVLPVICVSGELRTLKYSAFYGAVISDYKSITSIHRRRRRSHIQGSIPSVHQPTANPMNRNLLAYAYCITAGTTARWRPNNAWGAAVSMIKYNHWII